MDKSKIGTSEAIFLLATICLSHYLLSFPQSILYELKSSALLNLVFVSILAILAACLIVKLFKRFPGKDILDVSGFLGGKRFKNIIGIIFITYFIITSAILLRHFCTTLQVIYYPSTDIFFIVALFIVAIILISRLSNNASFKANLIIIPLTILGLIFIFVANFDSLSLERIFPILGSGFFNTFILGIGNIASFAGISLLYFLPPMLKEPEKFKKVGVIAPVICAAFFLIIMSTLLAMFPFLMNSEEIMPLYSAARNIEFGSFFQRLESIFLFVWIMLFASYVSIAIKFSIYIFKKLTNVKHTKILVYPFAILVFAIAMLVPNYSIAKYYESYIFKYIIVIFVIVFNILVLLLANLKYKKKVGKSYNE